MADLYTVELSAGKVEFRSPTSQAFVRHEPDEDTGRFFSCDVPCELTLTPSACKLIRLGSAIKTKEQSRTALINAGTVRRGLDGGEA